MLVETEQSLVATAAEQKLLVVLFFFFFFFFFIIFYFHVTSLTFSGYEKIQNCQNTRRETVLVFMARLKAGVNGNYA